jgi:hypothetical protein
VRSSIDYAGVAINIRFNNHSQNVAMFRTYQNCAMRYLFQGRTLLTEGLIGWVHPIFAWAAGHQNKSALDQFS